MSGRPIKVPWQATVIQQARALQCECPPWVLHGEAWHSPNLWVAQYWAAWCQVYNGAEAQHELEAADPNKKYERWAETGQFIKQRVN